MPIEVGRPLDEVWEYLADSENLPDWSDDFESCVRAGNDRGPIGEGTTYRFKLRAPAREGTFQYVDWDPRRRLRWDGDPIRATGGSIRPRGGYHVEAVGDDRTRVCLVFEPEPGGAMKLLTPLIRRSIRRGRTADAARLKQILESRAPGG